VDDAEERAAAIRLGELLNRLRTGQNLTQRELSRRGGIAWTFIHLLEQGVRKDTGRPVKPSPQSLQKIADGLAVDPHDKKKKNPGKAAVYYRQMMEARGWGSNMDLPATVATAPTPEDVREALATLTGPETAAQFSVLAEHWYAISPASRQFVLNALQYVKTQEKLP
jgi:transcriptional regulator with XRE-family HTH domain